MQYALTVSGGFNYAADKNDGGVFSNTQPDKTRQKLQGREIEVRNGRRWPETPSLAKEGLTLVSHPAGQANWADQAWIDAEYVPSCVELVKQVTGAKQAVHIFAPLQRRVDYGDYEGAAPTAGFLHIDQTLDTAKRYADQYAQGFGFEYTRAAIYNVWKPMTPPPQDYPLAVADRQTIVNDDLVYGETREWLGEGDEQVEIISPYYVLWPSEKQVFYYYPDMTPDESLVFVGVDLDASNPLGCAHSAFCHPSPQGKTVPRASIETRVLAIFE